MYTRESGPEPAQRLTEGVLTWHADGSLSALLTSMGISGWPSRSHKHTGCMSTRLAKGGQHPMSGLFNLLPFCTKVRQLVKFFKQSSFGDGGITGIFGANAGFCAVATRVTIVAAMIISV